MALQFLRVQNLMYFRSNHVHPTDPTITDNIEAKLPISLVEATVENSECTENSNESELPPSSSRSKCAICPVCILPAVVAFIFIFTIVQLIIIHHTIESYKLREQAYEDCYYPHGHGGGHSGQQQSRHEEYVQQLDLEQNTEPGLQSHGHGHRAMKNSNTASPTMNSNNYSHRNYHTNNSGMNLNESGPADIQNLTAGIQKDNE